MILQQQLQIHDDDTVSTFEEKHDDGRISSDPKGKGIPPSPSKVMPSTISNLTSIALTPAQMELLGNLMKLHIDEHFSEFQNQHRNDRQRAGNSLQISQTNITTEGRIETPLEIVAPDRQSVGGSS